MATSTHARRKSKKKSEAVGVIGLGIMGSAMAANLVRGGFRVTGYDVLPEAGRQLRRAGGEAARDIRGRRRCRRGDHHVAAIGERAYAGRDRAGAAGRKVIVIETSTLPIEVKSRRVALAGREMLLDCPLSGTGARRRAQKGIARRRRAASYRAVEGFRANTTSGRTGNGSKMKFATSRWWRFTTSPLPKRWCSR
jgi:3-hydroxyisobutyrate dehydrogenase-like beta-hydroxyacid dehydrogenase